VTKVKPRVSMATPVVCTLSPMYQLIKLDLPALWLPINITFTFFLGFVDLHLKQRVGGDGEEADGAVGSGVQALLVQLVDALQDALLRC
jgi:hypothetical protein